MSCELKKCITTMNWLLKLEIITKKFAKQLKYVAKNWKTTKNWQTTSVFLLNLDEIYLECEKFKNY